MLERKLLQTTFWGQQKPVLRLKKFVTTNKHINLSFLYQLHDYMFNFVNLSILQQKSRLRLPMNFFITLFGSSSGLNCKSFAIFHRTPWNLHGGNLVHPKQKPRGRQRPLCSSSVCSFWTIHCGNKMCGYFWSNNRLVKICGWTSPTGLFRTGWIEVFYQKHLQVRLVSEILDWNVKPQWKPWIC